MHGFWFEKFLLNLQKEKGYKVVNASPTKKLLQKVINIILGFLLGLAPLVVAAFFGLFFYSAFPNLTGITVIVASGILSIWLGVGIFKRIQIVGPMEFITAVNASPEADNLEPTPDGETKRRRPSQLAELINAKENLFRGGSIRIYGDWFGKPFDNKHEIIAARFDQDNNILTLIFCQGEKLQVFNPTHIFEASTFLKVVGADKVILTFFKPGSPYKEINSYFLDYQKEKKKIRTGTNVDWYKPIFDVSLGAPALMIFG